MSGWHWRIKVGSDYLPRHFVTEEAARRYVLERSVRHAELIEEADKIDPNDLFLVRSKREGMTYVEVFRRDGAEVLAACYVPPDTEVYFAVEEGDVVIRSTGDDKLLT